MEYRHELKFLVPDLTLEKLRYRLSAVMDIDEHQQEESYNIRSLYFDDCFDKCLNENLAGTDDRYKYRIRLYRGNTDYINLEKKYKYRQMTKKVSEQIDKADVLACLADGYYETGGALSTELYANYIKSGMRPKCIVEYDRCAFVEPIGNVRITFDMNLRGSADVERFLDYSEDFTVPVLPAGTQILEVKYDEFLPKHILQLVDTNNLHRQSISKYALVREAI
ncbi:polyphosphate polymerase domain-containing protein [Pseudobutyrivibrio sp. MD2005]|uniref:polyphosphate polymerase domain-containing protein n=1 Tax=Pseudobutyrivibrio sp. MD2005 TaxID=1410616 RepID=UPI000480BE1D|nr:polyphosphate polymerase domain-containing protein [Pseudobutyrivibrio sp. MD2005]